ncbi:glycerophosphodiester phosphodiesterase [Lacrimispora saccharolytica]|uniref:Glycerophosphoryl diester phosphodiesterase n=1 Tax=Lacrimispora saccharolytica (strain ATCC 35040 / DSM 2544 / NRCC 2533 / WM1) TaxID=610130 RepID=D9R2H3_LACSW|nr:glycerophosphodiester phosphodiesterase [Lacrimispora saccharolytica]ADL06597.1 glycerophosphoryl diester phosphodiesterase [[Clostridium] saccharolyticum WM1]QRV19329.1 glycerophosphoryl diester phosphodiesterase membrane domain-containing protein [Lacrimispora saccharolytica]
MGTLTKDTWKLIKLNQKNAFVFELLFRLVTTTLYLLLLNKGLLFALRMAGYSYLTAANIGYFLVKPWTVLVMAVMAVVGILILTLETGCLLTLYEGAYYSRRLKPWEILAGGFLKLVLEIRRKNWRLGLLVLADYVLVNLYLIYQMLTHVKPLNFVISEILKKPAGKLSVMLLLLLLLAAVIPGVYTFHGCMVEQKSFRDGYFRSLWLLRRRIFKVVVLLSVYYAAAVAGLWLVYAFCVLIAAVGVTLFTDNNLALAILPAACDRIELVLIFLTSMLLTLGNYGALSVQYFRFTSKLVKKSRISDYSGGKYGDRRLAALFMAAAAVFSLLSLFGVVRNGSAITADMLSMIQITAHRGSSGKAPENTMAAMAKALDDLADYVEIDVQETKDGVVVLGHDDSLKRVSGINRPISFYTFEELQKIDVGTWFSADFQGERIPSLEETMEFCKGRININIEIKDLGSGSRLPDKVAELIDKHQMREQCVVTSVRFSYLARIKELDPEIRTGYIISAAYGDYYSSDDIDFISLRSSFVSERLVEAAHEKGKAVHAWTVNSKSEMERMKMLGVDNIITDYPVIAREILYREAATESLLEYLRLVLK